MPGNLHELTCPGCGRVHSDLSTGTGNCWDHDSPWQYEQWGCASCGYLFSQASEHCCYAPVSVCQRCGGKLERWSGRVWFEDRPDDIGPIERMQGPCPGCDTRLTLADSTAAGNWD